MRLGPTELIVVLVIVVIVFGPTQIPKLTKMFGQSVKSFRDGMGADKAEAKGENKDEAAAKPDGADGDAQ